MKTISNPFGYVESVLFTVKVEFTTRTMNVPILLIIASYVAKEICFTITIPCLAWRLIRHR